MERNTKLFLIIRANHPTTGGEDQWFQDAGIGNVFRELPWITVEGVDSMARHGNALLGQSLPHLAFVSGGGDGGDRIVGKPQGFCYGCGGDGGHIVDSEHRIDRLLSGEFDHGLRGRLWMSNVEQQDVARGDRKACGNPLHPHGH